MRVLVDPPISDWNPSRPSAPVNRTPLRNPAHTSPSPQHPTPDRQPVLAAGHQARLWHPGILAKYLAAAHAARRLNAQTLNLVVDQDITDALTLELPIQENRRLTIHRLQLAPQIPHIPAVSHPPADPTVAIGNLREAQRSLGTRLQADLSSLIIAWTDLPTSNNLARQIAFVLERLMSPYTGPFPSIFATQLLVTPVGAQLVQNMLSDPLRCVTAYNGAAHQHPRAGIAPLTVRPDRVELPLWHISPAEPTPGSSHASPRRRVFAHIHPHGPSDLIAESGAPISSDCRYLAPRALLLTALMRAHFCDLFVHGTGGQIYDRVTEQWWKNWLGQELAPTATVTADLTLPFDAPIADRDQLRHALWWAHHLPHNLDRYPGDAKLDPDLIAEKYSLLAHMNDDHRPDRRATAFARIHAINEQFTQQNQPLVDEAQRQLDWARDGLANHTIATKRDWCFALYPDTALRELSNRIAQSPQEPANSPQG